MPPCLFLLMSLLMDGGKFGVALLLLGVTQGLSSLLGLLAKPVVLGFTLGVFLLLLLVRACLLLGFVAGMG